MASADTRSPASASDALDMVLTGMRYLNAADVTAMVTGEQARCLKLLEQVHAAGTAAHASVLGAFTTGQGYTEDGEYSPRSWLIHQADVTRAAAFASTSWARRVQEHPKIRQAMAGGIVSESWARAICEITGKIPQPGRDDADGLPGLDRAARRHPGRPARPGDRDVPPLLDGGPPDPAPEDRAVRLATTLGGALLRVHGGDLTPDRAAMVGAVLDALATVPYWRRGHPQQARAVPRCACRGDEAAPGCGSAAGPGRAPS